MLKLHWYYAYSCFQFHGSYNPSVDLKALFHGQVVTTFIQGKLPDIPLLWERISIVDRLDSNVPTTWLFPTHADSHVPRIMTHHGTSRRRYEEVIVFMNKQRVGDLQVVKRYVSGSSLRFKFREVCTYSCLSLTCQSTWYAYRIPICWVGK